MEVCVEDKNKETLSKKMGEKTEENNNKSYEILNKNSE